MAAVLREQVDFVRLKMNGVHGDQAGSQQTEVGQPA